MFFSCCCCCSSTIHHSYFYLAFFSFYLFSTFGLDGLVKEFALGEADPPLIGLAVVVGVDDVEEAGVGLLADLGEVGPEGLGLAPVSGGSDKAAKAEGLVAGNGEGLDGVGVEDLLGLAFGLVGDLAEAGGDVKGDVDEKSVGIAKNLKVTEEDVGLEETEGLVDDVLLVGRALGGGTFVLAGAEGEERQVGDVLPVSEGDGLPLVLLLVELTVVCSRTHFF